MTDTTNYSLRKYPAGSNVANKVEQPWHLQSCNLLQAGVENDIRVMRKSSPTQPNA